MGDSTQGIGRMSGLELIRAIRAYRGGLNENDYLPSDWRTMQEQIDHDIELFDGKFSSAKDSTLDQVVTGERDKASILKESLLPKIQTCTEKMAVAKKRMIMSGIGVGVSALLGVAGYFGLESGLVTGIGVLGAIGSAIPGIYFFLSYDNNQAGAYDDKYTLKGAEQNLAHLEDRANAWRERLAPSSCSPPCGEALSFAALHPEPAAVNA